MKALTAIQLLAPSPPLLFMGEEWGCRQPFLFFCDFDGELGEAVRKGRREEFSRFASFKDSIPDPLAESTFKQCVLDWTKRDADLARPLQEAPAAARARDRAAQLRPRASTACSASALSR